MATDEDLQELLELTRENNRMLRSMRRTGWISGILKLLFWIAMILATVYATQTYLIPLLKSMGLQSSSPTGLPSMSDFEAYKSQLQEAFQQYGNQMSQIQPAAGE